MNEKRTSLSDNPPGEYESQGSDSPGADVDLPKTEAAAEVPGEVERQIHGIKWFFTVAAVLSCVFLYSLDTTVVSIYVMIAYNISSRTTNADIIQVADIQPNIIASLGEFRKFPWLATAYALPACALVLIQAKLYGLFDIKWLYFGFVVLFEIGSAISGAAPTMNALIIGRLIAGIGGCGIYVGSLTFFSVITTPKERPIYLALISPTWGIGTVLGPIVSRASRLPVWCRYSLECK